MARATIIFLVTGPARHPHACFTNEAECVEWLQRHADLNLLDVWQMTNGGFNDTGAPTPAAGFLKDNAQ